MSMFAKIILAFLFASIVLSLFAYYSWYKPKFKEHAHSFFKPPKTFSEEAATLKARSAYIKKYVAVKHLNSKICFLIDMRISSGSDRFFVYDLQNDSVL